MKKILFINSPRVDSFSVVREERFEHKDIGAVYPPLNLLQVAAIFQKDGFKVGLIDANGQNLSWQEAILKAKNFGPDFIFSRLGFDTLFADLKFLEKLKEEISVPIGVRNTIAADVPKIRDQIIKNQFVDFFLNYEPESILPDLVLALGQKKDLKKVAGITFKQKNEIITTKEAQLVPNIDILPFPAYDLLEDFSCYYTGTLSAPMALITISQGCPFFCTFCAYNRHPYRTKSAQRVVAEIEWLVKKFGIKNFLFFDDLLGLDKNVLIEICKLLIKKGLRINWVSCTRANLVDQKILTLMKKAGCIEMAFGIESGSAKILKRVKKGITKEDIKRAAKLCHEVGIYFYAMIVLGLPGETEETIKETVDFILEIDPFYTQFCFATPFPNTEIFNYYRKRSYLETLDWSKYFPLSEKPIIRTKDLSADDLVRLRNWAYRKIIFRPKYLITKIKPFDWKWNFMAARKLVQRILAILRKKPVR